MQKHLLSTLLFFTLAFSASAQNAACDGMRYRDQVFTSVTRTNGVQFGTNTRYCQTVPSNLLMDVYEPTGDNAAARPVVFIGFGGSFIGGARADVDFLCEDFAKRGFVSVAFDYRLYTISCGIPDSIVFSDVAVKAVSDLRAAIRYMRANATTYKIDTNFVFTGGISAGAIVALHATYLDDYNEAPSYIQTAIDNNGGMEGNSNTITNVSSSVQGCFSMSGALHRKTMIDANDPPLVSIHETGDGTVPYGWGNAMAVIVPVISVEGSGNLHPRCTALGVPNYLVSVNATGHVGYLQNNPAATDDFMMNTALMFYNIICNENVPLGSGSVAQTPTPAYVFPNPANDAFTVNVPTLTGKYNISMSDMTGRVVRTINSCSGNSVTVNRDDLPNGLYFLSVQPLEDNARIETVKVILEK